VTFWDQISLMIWSAVLVLIPYAMYRKKWDVLPALVVLFFMMLINIFIGINTPNPDHVILVPVAVP
jgi:hypothetical protein